MGRGGPRKYHTRFQVCCQQGRPVPVRYMCGRYVLRVNQALDQTIAAEGDQQGQCQGKWMQPRVFERGCQPQHS